MGPKIFLIVSALAALLISGVASAALLSDVVADTSHRDNALRLAETGEIREMPMFDLSDTSVMILVA